MSCRKNATLVMLIVLSSVFLTSCWDQRPIEEIAIITVLGIDVAENNPNLLVVSTSFPIFQEQSQGQRKVTTVTGASMGRSLELWQNRHAMEFGPGKLHVVIVGEDAAKRGMNGLIALLELPRVNDNAVVVVARGRAEDIIRSQPVENACVGDFLRNLLNTAERLGNVVRFSVAEVVSRAAAADSDIFLPLINQDDIKESLVIEGTALFQELYMVGELSQQETQLLIALMGRSRRVLYSPSLGHTDELYSAFPQVIMQRPGSKLRVINKNGNLRVRFDFHADFSLSDYASAADLTKYSTVNNIERDIESNLTIELERLLAKLQANKVDPLGIGLRERIRDHQGWVPERFREQWKAAEVEVNCRLRMSRPGTIIKTTLDER